MSTLLDLYEKQGAVGEMLSSYLQKKGITKIELSEKSGVSRPTIDKLLSGAITSSTNYQKHMGKILQVIDLTPDYFIKSELPVMKNHIRDYRQSLGVSVRRIEEKCGIRAERLKEIEEGAEASLLELRDIALCLGTSIATVLGKYVFRGQTSEWSGRVVEDNSDLAEFWGHIGILARNSKKYRWYPITEYEVDENFYLEEKNLFLIPCMNNRVLLINKKNINKIKLLDEACDRPENAGWDNNISVGEVPLVLYEALDDYLLKGPDEQMSELFIREMESFIYEYGITEDNGFDHVDNTRIIYADGYEEVEMIDFSRSKGISAAMDQIYTYCNDHVDTMVYANTDLEGMIGINLDNVAIMDMPYLKLEKAIYKLWEIGRFGDRHQV